MAIVVGGTRATPFCQTRVEQPTNRGPLLVSHDRPWSHPSYDDGQTGRRALAIVDDTGHPQKTTGHPLTTTLFPTSVHVRSQTSLSHLRQASLQLRQHLFREGTRPHEGRMSVAQPNCNWPEASNPLWTFLMSRHTCSQALLHVTASAEAEVTPERTKMSISTSTLSVAAIWCHGACAPGSETSLNKASQYAPCSTSSMANEKKPNPMRLIHCDQFLKTLSHHINKKVQGAHWKFWHCYNEMDMCVLKGLEDNKVENIKSHSGLSRTLSQRHRHVWLEGSEGIWTVSFSPMTRHSRFVAR